MGDQILPKTALKSNQDQLRLKRGWYKDATTWLNHWGIDKNSTLQDINNIRIIITSKFKEKMWDKKVLEVKRKLQYYKEVINPNLEVQNYLFVLTSSKKKINIAKIRTNSHELHSETGRWTIPKMPWVERTCHLCESTNFEGERHFLLYFPA